MARRIRVATTAAGVVLAFAAVGASAAQPAAPSGWVESGRSADARAEALLGRLTLDEKISLVRGHFPVVMKRRPEGAPLSAGWFPGVPRLGIPPLKETDASLGVANAGREPDDETALPSGMALAATWDVDLARRAGAMIGQETRAKGFNILLAGGVNLVRDPYNGRAFEYLGEDPLLAGTMAGASIRGIQSAHVVSTTKHFALNAQETGRLVLNARIDEAALRESDLLAFQIAIEAGEPGSVMCAYNKVNGLHACENPDLLQAVLKRDWGYKGWVMSDWGAVRSVHAATAGLDQESGSELDKEAYFDQPLREALRTGAVPPARLDDMVRRVLRSLFAAGGMDYPAAPGPIDVAAHEKIAEEAAISAIVVLENRAGLLPLAAGTRRIAVIGGRADVGVLSGGGSSQVVPKGSTIIPAPAGLPAFARRIVYHPSAPLAAIRARAGGEVVFNDGTDPAAAAAVARHADVVVLLAPQWSTEGADHPLELEPAQTALIEAVTRANPKTIVVLETGGSVLTPWADRAGALVEAWYGGSRGGEAIAKVLFGEADAAGRLPVSFPQDIAQLPRPTPVGLGVTPPEGAGPEAKTAPSFDVDYREGSSVGYRWFAQTGQRPRYPFGYGLSYTSFRYGDLQVRGGTSLSASFSVTNTGARAGVETAQLYLRAAPNRRQQRLLGWKKVALKPGETRWVEITADPRLLADWDVAGHGWRIAGGEYRVFAGPHAAAAALEGAAAVQPALLAP